MPGLTFRGATQLYFCLSMDHHEVQTKAGQLCPWKADETEKDRIYVGVYVDNGTSLLDQSTLITWCRCKRDSLASIVLDSFKQRRPEVADHVVFYDNVQIAEDSQVTFNNLSSSFPIPQTHAMLLRAIAPFRASTFPTQSSSTNEGNTFAQTPAEDFFVKSSPESPSLQNDSRRTPPESSTAAVQEGVKFLNGLQCFFKEIVRSYPNAHSWLDQIEQVLAKATETKTVIGMVDTGAGKSSAANVLLDEERLVPTSCMRACTAVITEISYNHGSESYRAEIDFVDAEDWRFELKILFEEMLESNEGAIDGKEST